MQLNTPSSLSTHLPLASSRRVRSITWWCGPKTYCQLKGEARNLDIYRSEVETTPIQQQFGYLPGSPFHDERVRQAVSMAFDRELWIETVYNTNVMADAGLPLDYAGTRVSAPALSTRDGGSIPSRASSVRTRATSSTTSKKPRSCSPLRAIRMVWKRPQTTSRRISSLLVSLRRSK